MTSTKKKTYAALLALAGIVMLIDRFVLGGAGPMDVPASAIAQLVRPGADAAAAASAVAPQTAIPSLVFPRALPRADLQNDTRDFFAPPVPKDPTPPEALADQQRANPQDHSTKSFVAQFRLKAVLSSGGRRIAVINDRWHQEGDVIGGCRIDDIAERKVKIYCHDGVTTLVIGPSPSRIGH